MIVTSGLEPKTYQVTPAGLQELQEQLDELKQRRRQAAEEIRDSTSQSTDIGARVDSAFAASRNEASGLDAEIALLERIIALAEIIEIPADKGRVQLGSKVSLQIDGQTRDYDLVGALEADPGEGKISDESPLGRSLLGKQVGEQFEIQTPAGLRRSAEVLGIA